MKRWCLTSFGGLLLWLSFLLLYASSPATGSSGNPITRMSGIHREMKTLLVKGPAGWMIVRNISRYQYLERQLDQVWHVLTWNPYWAIQYVFGSRAAQAWAVAKCEGGRPVPSPRAHNGQYLGIFQMGSSERHLYGHGPSPLAQARAAYRYSSGGRNWGPWQCKP